jgi:Ceramidase
MTKPIFYKLLIRSFFATIALICLWMSLNTLLNGHIWDGMTISKSALTVEYCEFNNVDKLFHQCMNTYSNAAYFFFGVLIVLIAWEDYKNRGFTVNSLEQFPLLSALMGFCFIYLSFGSALFHASLTWVGQRVDMNGTYSISITLLGIGLYAILPKNLFTNNLKKLWVIILFTIILLFIKIALLISSSVLIPILILFQLLLIIINYVQFRKERSIIVGILSFVLIFIALKIRTLDVQKIGCDPYSLYQGHAVWHLLTALSSFCSYSFFRFKFK